MSVFGALVGVTLRALLARRRTILLALLAALPVLIALLVRVGGGNPNEARIFEAIVRSVLPLVALVFGTAALGGELEDGTAVYLLAKPVPRWQIVAAKALVAGSLAAGLSVASTVGATVIAIGFSASAIGTAAAFGVAAAVASFAYVALFVAASALTGRALILGLIYTLVWEGALAGILEGTRQFSVREATIGIASLLAPAGTNLRGGLEPGGAVALVVVLIVGGLALASWRLGGWEVRGTE
ncbi:MAG TPA: ABC transporter permease subunit [Candidatus Limnocylindrales bacterium]|jgi:ABC-2 type transport system permease protein